MIGRPPPTLCIYHGSCSDGFSAAWAVHKKFGNFVRFYPATYGHPPPEVAGEHVVIADFSYKEPVLRGMCNRAASITVLDHHQTAEEDLRHLLSDNIISGIFDTDRSGAVITWQYYHKEPVPNFLLHVQDRDLLRFLLRDTKEILACATSHPYDFEIWDELVRRCEHPLLRKLLIVEGCAIERKHLRDVKLLLAMTCRRMVIGGIDVPVANITGHLASTSADMIGAGEVFTTSYLDRQNYREFSLRSQENGGIDVAEIAKGYGGGGHKNSAGFRVPFTDLERLGLL